MAANPFSKVPMNHEQVYPALLAAGVTELVEEKPDPQKRHRYLGNFDGQKVLINLFINGGGTCTVGYATGYHRPTFDKLAQTIVDRCRWGATAQLNYSIQQVERQQVDNMEPHIVGLGAKLNEVEDAEGYKLWRYQGPAGDVLTVKHHATKTLQLQGKHAQVAVWALDYVRLFAPSDEVLEQDRKAFQIGITVEQTKDELAQRIPVVHSALQDEVRLQFTSALALTKVEVQLEDYAALAFPALRGLEGFCFQMMHDHTTTLRPGTVTSAQLGEYFEKNPREIDGYIIKQALRSELDPGLQELLASCYTVWHKQRHSLFHMKGAVETSRILEERADAISIVDQVLALVNRTFANFLRSKQ